MRGRPVAFLLAAILAASCDAKSPVASTPPAPRVDLQFGRGFVGYYVDLLNGTPVFYILSDGFSPNRPALLSTQVTLYAVDKDGVYEDVTTQGEIVSSNPAIARPEAAGRVALRGSRGRVTITATYSGMSSSLTFTVEEYRPLSLEAGLVPAAAGHEISWSAWIVTGFSTHTTLDRDAVQWSSSDPSVVSVTGSTLRANAPGTADLTMRYNAMEASYRLTVPPLSARRDGP